MGNTEFLVDPKEAGIEFGTSGNPSKKGWKVVSPDVWFFRNNQVADKIQTVEGYSDPDYYMDCTKAKIVCDVHDEMPSASPGELHAEIFKRYLDIQNILIRPRELLIGNWGNDEHGIVVDPRSDLWYTFKEFYDYEKAFIWENGQKKPVSQELYGRIHEFCKKNDIAYAVKPYMSEKLYRMYFEGGLRFWEVPGTSGFRANPDHTWYLKKGFRQLIKMMENTIERLTKELDQTTGSNYVELAHRINDCYASIKATESVISWIKRHAKTAREMALKENDPKERERLDTLSSICEWIAENPPRTFWEMMQLNWLSLECYYLIEHASHSITFRPDQVWWEWYEKDVLIDKTLSRQQASDIICFYFLKYHEIGLLVQFQTLRKSLMGGRDFTVLTLGGQTSNGSDATNDLSMLILDVIDGYRLHFPDVKFRWHQKFDRKNLKRVVEVMRTGMGSPSVKNDTVSIPGMMHQYGNISLEEARSWAVVGCITPGITINSRGAHRRSGRIFNAFKPAEMALFNGQDPEPGWEFATSLKTGDPTKFTNFEEFYQAWLKQWEWLMRTGVNLRNIVDDYYQNIIRRPFLSMLYERCVTEGKDIMKLGTSWLSFNNVPGWVDSMDSLAAIKYWVFDKKKYTMQELLIALKADWEGYEDMQNDFKEAPKFGNNDNYVDDIVSRGVTDVGKTGKLILDLQNDSAGLPSGLIATMMYHLAPYTGAMPNGRKRGEPMCDGGVNPHAEFDKGGPWDRLASAMKIDQTMFKAMIYNQKIDYNSVKGEYGLDKLLELTEAGLEGGIDMMQYNMVAKEILEDAKKEPEKYPFLAVRISGYSAYFTVLPEYVQDAIIDRVDHEL